MLENGIMVIAKKTLIFFIHTIVVFGVVKRLLETWVHCCYVVNTEPKAMRMKNDLHSVLDL